MPVLAHHVAEQSKSAQHRHRTCWAGTVDADYRDTMIVARSMRTGR
jgi:hypothetical protein